MLVKRETKVMQPAREVVQTTEEVLCDVCKEKIDPYDTDDNWSRQRVKIGLEKVTSYPECGWREQTFIDICAKCFLEKVKPLLERELGVTFGESEENW